jgi:DNA-3-methyladenine glycosylase II
MSHEKYVLHFNAVDPVIANMLTQYGKYEIPTRTDHFDALIRAIVGQQVSVKAADTVYGRLVARYNGILDPSILRNESKEDLREVGISRQKASYINDLSVQFLDRSEIFENLEDQTDLEIITALTSIKGIGVWTAQMFLMFTLGRLDVFPIDDLAIRKAMTKLYDLPKETKYPAYTKIAESWAPYRSVACWYLWLSLH